MNYQDIVVYVLLVCMVVLVIWNLRLEARLRKFFRGKQPQNLEATFKEIISEIEKIHDTQKHANKQRSLLHSRLQNCVQGVATIRFNPFSDSGGNQSFATCFLNEHGDGVVLSSLYAHGQTSVFAKPIVQYASSHELTEEERHVLKQAQV